MVQWRTHFANLFPTWDNKAFRIPRVTLGDGILWPSAFSLRRPEAPGSISATCQVALLPKGKSRKKIHVGPVLTTERVDFFLNQGRPISIYWHIMKKTSLMNQLLDTAIHLVIWDIIALILKMSSQCYTISW